MPQSRSIPTIGWAGSQGGSTISTVQLSGEKTVRSRKTKSSWSLQLVRPIKRARSNTAEKLKSTPKKTEAVEAPIVEGELTIDAATPSKDEAKKVRRTARRARWAARWYSVKKLGRKTRKALILSGTFVFKLIAVPIIIVLELVVVVLALVAGLVLQVAGLFCFPFQVLFTDW